MKKVFTLPSVFALIVSAALCSSAQNGMQHAAPPAQTGRTGQDTISVVLRRGVFHLRFGVAPANLHCIQFVPANPAGENLDTPAGRIELPSAAPENDWDGKRPLLFPYRKFHPVRSEGVSINLELFMRSEERRMG